MIYFPLEINSINYYKYIKLNIVQLIKILYVKWQLYVNKIKLLLKIFICRECIMIWEN